MERLGKSYGELCVCVYVYVPWWCYADCENWRNKQTKEHENTANGHVHVHTYTTLNPTISETRAQSVQSALTAWFRWVQIRFSETVFFSSELQAKKDAAKITM